LWLSRIKYKIGALKDLEYSGFLSHKEYLDLLYSLSFIWKVRSHLHQLTGRKYDQLHFEHQVKLAGELGYEKTGGLEPVECFLGDLHGHMEFVKIKHLMFLYETGPGKKWFKFKRKTRKRTPVKGLTVRKDMLHFVSNEDILTSPVLLVKIFEESARLKIPLSSEAKRLVKEFSYLVDDGFRKDKRVVSSFERILITPAPEFNVLSEMLSTGLLLALIPEFALIVDRIEYDAYHIFPVDKHCLRTVQMIKRFGLEDDPFNEKLLFELSGELSRKRTLLWAALLHDIGKGAPDSDHSVEGGKMARTILGRFGLKEKDVNTIVFLVEAHVFLYNTATRRDINDEETAIFCARRVMDLRNLKMLYLLTAADLMATGPKAWTEWVSVLLRELFLKTRNVLEHNNIASLYSYKIIENKKEKLQNVQTDGNRRQRILDLMEQMSHRYIRFTSPEDILSHVQLFERLLQEEGQVPFVWRVEKNSHSNTRSVTICAPDRPGLLAKIAGTFTLNNINILDVLVYTWHNGYSIQVFKVTPPPDQIYEDERWERTGKNLREILDGERKLSVLIGEKLSKNKPPARPALAKPLQIEIDNSSSSFFTIIEVYTYDFPGLLFLLADNLYRRGLNIKSAQIATKVDQVVDVFYVRDFDGNKVDDPDRVAKIRKAIENALPTEKEASETMVLENNK
jgi:[protein-PII] uridylyltransferase